MTRERRILDALLAKTVANGCTPEEACSAHAKAEEMAAKYGIPLEAPKQAAFDLDAILKRAAAEYAVREAARKVQEVHDMMRRAAEQFKANATKKAAQAKPETKRHSGMTFASIGEAACWYLRFNAHLSHGEIAAEIKRLFPNAKTTAASVAWYASKMKKERR